MVEQKVNSYQKKIGSIEGRTHKSTHKRTQDDYKQLDEDLTQNEDEVDELATIVENVDNNHRLPNFQLKGLKEGLEGDDMVGYLEEFLTGYMRSNKDCLIKIDVAVWIRRKVKSPQHPREIKSMVI